MEKKDLWLEYRSKKKGKGNCETYFGHWALGIGKPLVEYSKGLKISARRDLVARFRWAAGYMKRRPWIHGTCQLRRQHAQIIFFFLFV